MSPGLIRLRVLIVVAMAAVVAIAAGDVFDRLVWWLLLPPAAVGLAELLSIARRWLVRFLWAAAATVAAVVAVVVVVGGNGGDVVAAFGAGFPAGQTRV